MSIFRYNQFRPAAVRPVSLSLSLSFFPPILSFITSASEYYWTLFISFYSPLNLKRPWWIIFSSRIDDEAIYIYIPAYRNINCLLLYLTDTCLPFWSSFRRLQRLKEFRVWRSFHSIKPGANSIGTFRLVRTLCVCY